MVGQPKLLQARTILVIFVLVSGACGWFVPAFYDWTEADQSRPSPLMWQVPSVLAVGALVLAGGLPWIPISGWDVPETTEVAQFNLRSVLILMSGVAIAIAVGKWAPLVVAFLGLTLALAAAARCVYCYPAFALPVVALCMCMFLPFVWILGSSEFLRSALWMFPSLPGFFLAALIASLVGASQHNLGWLAILITATQVAIGLWSIRVGPKPAIATIVFVMLASLTGSLLLHALVRA